jgi:hypothetical protein
MSNAKLYDADFPGHFPALHGYCSPPRFILHSLTDGRGWRMIITWDRPEFSDRSAAFADPPLLPVVFLISLLEEIRDRLSSFSIFLLGEIRDRLSSFSIFLQILCSIGFHSKNQRICISSRFV